MTASDMSMILFNRLDFGLDEASHILAKRGLTVKREGDSLNVRWDDSPILHVAFARGEAIQQQAAQIGQGTSHAVALSTCDARFEITFDSLDDVLDEINTLIEVQATLQDATQGLLFNTWNRRLQSVSGE